MVWGTECSERRPGARTKRTRRARSATPCSHSAPSRVLPPLVTCWPRVSGRGPHQASRRELSAPDAGRPTALGRQPDLGSPKRSCSKSLSKQPTLRFSLERGARGSVEQGAAAPRRPSLRSASSPRRRPPPRAPEAHAVAGGVGSAEPRVAAVELGASRAEPAAWTGPLARDTGSTPTPVR
eukprot:364919-Chlamydomonas_euryale.AAC.4